MKIAIVGGGAAGLMAASVASEKHRVVLFERQSRVGKKISASGNGKCNLSNSSLAAERLAEAEARDVYNRREAYGIVSRFDYTALMKYCGEVLGLETYADAQGRVYPRTENSGSVIDAFRLRCQKNNVKTVTDAPVVKIEKSSKDFIVWLGDGQYYHFDRVIFCVGSNIQTRNFTSFDLLNGFDIAITPTQTSLVPVKTKKVWLPLNGTRVKCGVSLLKNGKKRAEERGEVLFRDYGLSGIAVFNLSAYIARSIVMGEKADFSLSMDLFPELSEEELVSKLTARLDVMGADSKTFFVGLLCNKLAEAIIRKKKLPPALAKSDISGLAAYMKNIEFQVSELCDAEKGQVMCGGIDMSEIDENMQSKKVPGLYFAGECLDADGLCGGFNLHFAFACGYIAGSAV